MFKFALILTILSVQLISFSQGTTKIVTDYSGNIKSFKEVNSVYLDFSLVVSGGHAYFASSREPSLLTFKENNWAKTAKINIYKADILGLEDYYEVNVTNIEQVVEIKDQFTHVGPLCFSASGDTMFFTKVPSKVNDKNIRILKPQLFMLTKNGDNWNETAQQLSFNNPMYIFAHPSYNSKTKTLYFVSDLKDGAGGKDIYTSNLVDGKWTKPLNLKTVNTKSDEVFPHLGEDNTLFFSSNRSEGKGGLDVYYLEDGSRDSKNLTYLNSATDDFGFFKVPGKNIGFLSSNRSGNDDIYTITINKEKNFKSTLFGKFKYTKLEEAIEQPLTVYLLNEKKEPVQEAFVNENGEFEFADIGLLEDYTIQAKSKSPMDLVMFDSEGNPDSKMVADESDKFVYKILDMSDIGSLNLKQTNEKGEVLIAGKFLYEDNPTEETGLLKVNLIDSKGKIAHTVTSDKNGFFDFTNLPKDQDYIVELAEENEDLTLIIFNADGKVVERLKPDGSGLYLYRKLQVLDIFSLEEKKYVREDPFSFGSGLINGDFDKNGADIEFSEQLNISVYDEKGNFIDSLMSNKSGQFKYQKLDGIENYSFKLDKMSEDFDLSGISLKISDDDGELIKEILPELNGDFVYRSLEILNIQALKEKSQMDEGEFDFLAGIGDEVAGKVKYNNQSINLGEGLEVKIYDENSVLLNQQITSKTGDFNFTETPNKEAYIIQIEGKPDSMKMELFTIDMKKEKFEKVLTLLPQDADKFRYQKLDLVDNEDGLSSINKLEESLSLIFDVNGNFDYEENEGEFVPDLEVHAYDGNGNKLGQAFTDKYGNFVFRKLPGISTVLFKLESLPENYDLDLFALYIVGDDGKQLAKLQSGEKGFFVYKPLGFASEIPENIKDQFSDQSKHSTFGTNALDFSSEIESVYFGSNKANPNNSDLIKVEKMLLLLEIDKDSKLEISAYADSRASDNYNLILSERRANWIKSYLVGKGVEGSRVIVNAYGEGKLVNDCEDGIDCPDKFHALNRRAELRIIN